MTQNNIYNFFKTKTIHFSESSKNIEIQKFEPPKNGPNLRMYENIRVSGPPGVLTCEILTWDLQYAWNDCIVDKIS